MTLSSTTSKVSYDGDDSTTVFAYTFKVFDEDDLVVYIYTEATGAIATQTINVDYTVSGVGNTNGGNVTMTNAPATGTVLIIKRNQPLTQTTNYGENDPFPAETHEAALDRLTMALQTLAERVDRAFKLPVSTESSDPEIPDGTAYADKYLKWNSDGSAIEAVAVDSLSGTFADVVGDTSPQLGGALDMNTYNLLIDGGSSKFLEATDSNEYLSFVKTASAVNYFGLANAATGNGPILYALGDDTNVDFNVICKGSGTFAITGNAAVSGTLAVTGNLSTSGTFTASSTCTVTGTLSVAGTSSQSGLVKLFEDTDNGTNFIGHKADDALSGDTTYSWPGAPGSDKILQSDSSGQLSWVDEPSFTLPAASSSQMTAGSSNAVAGTPGNLKYHKGVASAVCGFYGPSGTAFYNYGIASINRTGTGAYTVTFSETYSTSPCVVAVPVKSTGDALVVKILVVSATQCTLACVTANNSATATDPDWINLSVIGSL